MCRSTRIRSCCTYAVAVPSTHRVDRHSVCGADQGGAQHFARMKIGAKLFRIGQGFALDCTLCPSKRRKRCSFIPARTRAESVLPVFRVFG